MISRQGMLCARTDSTAAHVSRHRFSVCAQITTEMLRAEVMSVLARVGSGWHRGHGAADLDYSRRHYLFEGSALLYTVTECLNGNDPEDPPAIDEDMEVAHPVDAPELVAWHFLDSQSGLGDADVHHGLDLEADAVEAKGRQMPGPERVIAVTQVCVPGAEGEIHHDAQDTVAQSAGDVAVVAPPRVGEPWSLGLVCSGDEGAPEAGNLGAVGGAVAVDHDDDVACA